MSWQTEWRALSSRITSLLDAGHFYAEMMKVYSSDSYGAAQALIQSAFGIFEELKDFVSRTTGTLPTPAKTRLINFINASDAYFRGTPATSDERFQRVVFCLTALRSLQSDVDYLLADTEVIARNLVARAFLHLQRSIIADKGIRKTWQEAYDDGETACESLGATHLLLHGIWAFKAYAAGERTDLVLGGKLQLTPEIESAAEALVLTEWKLVGSNAQLKQKSIEAFEQARLYGAGSLAGFELASNRYLVMVSKSRLEMPPDHPDGNVLYQYRNVAVDPPTPSTHTKAIS
ncbi:MAG: hypothetical protein ACLQU2_28355 [Candidatus Binataceae bacterium]